ncbi:MAG: DNA phosphorothioation-dependent restriction protein DptH, partial [Bacteroidaceae bacterium]|nr:DNA phosphorothioation-dependent restriction protein DptH [Bacteroidaceae bacterium]
IHYSDQYTNSSGYDDITVSNKSEQYLKIIREHLQKRNVDAKPEEMEKIIGLFNAINGEWLLKMISAKEGLSGEGRYFTKEKLSILSSIKMMLAQFSDPKITWIPISLEEILRVSGGAGLSQKDGLLSAKNLGFEERPTCDDLLMVGIQSCVNEDWKPFVKVFLHPVEVKIGYNESHVIEKAVKQVNSTWEGLHSVWNPEGSETVEAKLSRNFFMQLILINAEKMALNGVFPSQDWNLVIEALREDLLNERYVISTELDPYLGKGTVVSFKNNAIQIKSIMQEDVQVIEAPMRYGDQFLIRSVEDLEKDSDLRDGCQFLSTNQEVQSVLTQHAEGKTQTSDDVIEG